MAKKYNKFYYYNNLSDTIIILGKAKKNCINYSHKKTFIKALYLSFVY